MKIARREVVLPDDNDLKAQLLDRKKVPNSQGKLAIERKVDMKKGNREGGPAQSPDRADAVLGAIFPLMNARSISTGPGQTWLEESRDEMGGADLPGASC